MNFNLRLLEFEGSKDLMGNSRRSTGRPGAAHGALRTYAPRLKVPRGAA